MYECLPELRHFEHLEKEAERKARGEDLAAQESSDDNSETRSELCRRLSRDSTSSHHNPYIPISKLHESAVFWLRV
jgi:hypothetical protein